MEVFKVKAPDGTIIKVRARDEATAIRGAKEHYASLPTKKPDAVKDAGSSFVGGLTKGVAGIADLVTQASPVGAVSNMFQNAAGVADMMKGGGAPKPGNSFSGLGQEAATRAHKPQTGWGEAADTLGQNAVNAFAPGGVGARIANVLIPAATTEIAGRTARATGAGPKGEAIARTVGGVIGAGVASVRPQNMFAPKAATPEAQVANTFAARAKADPAEMRAEAQKLRDAGLEPTLADVTGDRGRRLIRAVGTKDATAGETLSDNARTVSSSAKPAIIARTRAVGPMRGQTADEVKAGLEEARSTAADTNYREPYQTKVSVTSETLRALSGEPGKQALQQARKAAVARMDDAQVAEIDNLLGAAGDPPTQISAGTMDRVRIALRERATAAGKKDQNAYASGLNTRRGMIDETLDKVDELKPARADFRAKSQAIGVLGKDRKDVFSTDPADYGRWLEGLPPEAKQANQIAIRQEIMDTLGGQRSSTMGSIDELATSEYARANLKQALGPEADQYLANIEGRLNQVRNARFVDPNANSRTAVLENDLSGVVKGAADVARAGMDVKSGNWVGLVSKAADWLKSRGIPEQEAQAIAKASTDPKALEMVTKALEERLGRQAAREFLSLRNAGLVGAAAGSTGFRAASGQDQPER